MQLNFDDLKSECCGRWPGIFGHFGVDVGSGKHKPCPSCGGKDRFRFDGAYSHGNYICGQCGSGDGFSLLMKVFNWDFTECIEKVGGVVGMAPIHKVPKLEKKDPAILLRAAYNASEKLHPSDLVSKYLRARGLVLTPNDILFCPNCYESDTKTKIPAMMGIIRNKSGEGISIHRTYLNNDKKADIDSPKKIMPVKEPLLGSSVRLFNPDDKIFKSGTLGVAEGIETAMAASQLFQIATWSCLSTSILESFDPPDGINEIWIFSDNDANFAGQKSAYILANRLYLKDYLVKVMIPDRADWNDELIAT